MNQMEIFKNPEFGSIRVIEENGKYLFCGLDKGGRYIGLCMCSIFLIPEPANIPAPPGYGRWRNRIRSLCLPCWNAPMRSAARTLPSSWRRWLTSWQANTGPSIVRTFSISLTIPF